MPKGKALVSKLELTASKGIAGCLVVLLCCAPPASAQYGIESWTTDQGLPQNLVYAIHHARDGYLWVATYDGLARFDGVRFTVFERGTTPGIASNRFNSIYESIDGALWLGPSGGVTRLADGEFVTYTTDHGLPSLLVTGITGNEAGNVWAVSDGVIVRWAGDRFRPLEEASGVRFTASKWTPGVFLGFDGRALYRFSAGALTSWPAPEPVRAMSQVQLELDEVGRIWVRSADRRYVLVDSGRAMTAFSGDDLDRALDRGAPGPGDPIAPYTDARARVWPLQVDNQLTRRMTFESAGEQQRIRYHEFNGGLRVFDGTRFTPLADRILPDHTVVPAIHHDPDGTVWLGTARGLVRYRDGTTTWYTDEDGLPGDDVKVVISDRAGGLWIGGYGGVSHLSGGRVRSWTEQDGVPGGVRALYLDDRGVLWIGSYDNGLGRLEDGRAVRITTREGLFNNGAFQILEDDRGYLWMGCNRGIYRVRKAELDAWAAGRLTRVTSLAIGRSDGLRNVETNGGTWPAGLKAVDGTLWFPTQAGVAIIDPASWQPRTGEVPVRIEAALVDREPVPLDRRFTLGPDHRHLEIQYTGLSFVGSEHIMFRYQLIGLDDEWVDAGTRRTANYSHVPPGEYTFQVIAAGAGGVWSSTPATIAMRVVPPFWRTWWFGGLTLAATGGLTVFGYRRRVAALERAHAAQEAFSRQLLASEERERKRIAGELHDGLGQSLIVLRNWAALGISQLEPAAPGREELDEIARAAARALEEMRAIAHNLGPYDLERLGLADTLADMAERLQGSSGIAFRVDVDAGGADARLSRDAVTALYRVAQETLTNVVKHAGATEVSIVLTRAGRGVRLTIRDNGAGFDPDAAPRGFGLHGMAERIRLVDGELTLRSASGKGTTVDVVVGRGPTP